MKNLLSLLLLTGLLFTIAGNAQCGQSEFCNGNVGLYSNDNATDIAYDNIGSSYHASFIKEPNGGWKVWGANLMPNGSSPVLSPRQVTPANYPGLTGTIYKLAIGDLSQLVILTSTGLFAVGSQGVISTSIAPTAFTKLTVNGKLDGLPLNITPNDVKMLFVSSGTVIITTCNGEVYVLSTSNRFVAGDGSTTLTGTLWHHVMQDATTPLTNVIVTRGDTSVGFALKSDGSIWTWGQGAVLGNGTAAQNLSFATQMTLPAGLPAIKMIQSTGTGSSNSYYILGTDKKVYSLGSNNSGQLGDRTTTVRVSWVNAKNPDNSIISDAAWISSNEHDNTYQSFSVIRTSGEFYTAGSNSYGMIGRTSGSFNYLDLPQGINSTDVITQAECGGHSTAVIKLGSPRYGYVGHRIDGSMGDGSASDEIQESFDFITPPIVAVCGTVCAPPVLTSNSPICDGSNAVFTITANPGDTITYQLNGGAAQTIVTDASGQAQVVVTNPLANQTLQLTFILGAGGSCSNALFQNATVSVGGNVIPLFTQVPQICAGDALNPLPTTSLNSVQGTWSPALDNTQTTTYTFTPLSAGCATTTTMTIFVAPVNTVPTFTQMAPVCPGATIGPLPTFSDNGIEGTWSPAINNQVTTTYTFTPLTVGSCIPSVTMTIQILPANVPIFDQLAPICEGDALQLPSLSNNGISGTWSPAVNNQQTTTYTFTGTSGICPGSNTMTVVVNQKANPLFQQVAAVCEGSFLANLPQTSANNISGSWSPAINNLSTTIYTFTPDTGECANPAQMTIVINPKINPVFPAFATLCFGDPTFVLPTVSNNNIAGTWQPSFSNIQTGTYTFTPDPNECANPATAQVEVFEDFDFELMRFCENGNLFLQVIPTSSNFDTATASVNWQYNNVNVGSLVSFNVTSYLTSTEIDEELPITFNAIVTNQNGCNKSKAITLQSVYCDIQKGISPNGDHLNDFFDLRLLNVSNLNIYNRYGVKVYSKGHYTNEWHGQSDNGSILPDATYYYQIDFESAPSKTGWIYINNEN